MQRQVGTYKTSGLKYEISGYQVMYCKLDPWMTSLQQRTPHSICPKEKKKTFTVLERVSKPVCAASIHLQEKRCSQLTPPTFSKWEASFLKSVSVPLKYHVKLMSSIGSCWTWQGKMTLSPTVTSMFEGAKMILVGSESRKISYWISVVLRLACH